MHRTNSIQLCLTFTLCGIIIYLVSFKYMSLMGVKVKVASDHFFLFFCMVQSSGYNIQFGLFGFPYRFPNYGLQRVQIILKQFSQIKEPWYTNSYSDLLEKTKLFTFIADITHSSCLQHSTSYLASCLFQLQIPN